MSKSLVVLDITKYCFQPKREMTHYFLAFHFLGNQFIDLQEAARGVFLLLSNIDIFLAISPNARRIFGRH